MPSRRPVDAIRVSGVRVMSVGCQSVKCREDFFPRHPTLDPRLVSSGSAEIFWKIIMHRLTAIATVCIFVGLAVGCGSSPASRFYTLSAGECARGDVIEPLGGRRTGVGAGRGRPTADCRHHRPESGSTGRVQSLGIAAAEQYRAGGRRESCRDAGYSPGDFVVADSEPGCRLSRGY